MNTALLMFAVLVAAVPPGKHVAERTEDAVDQPNGKKIMFRVEAGSEYPLLKRGGPAKQWCKLSHQDLQGWVRCPEGAAVEAPKKADRESTGARCPTSCNASPLFP